MSTDEYSTTIDNLESELRTMRSRKKELEKDLRRIDTKMRYSPDNDELATERDGVVDTIADLDSQIEEKQTELETARNELHREQVKAERERLADEAQGYHFSVPDDDPIVGCQMLAAIADRLQYQFLSSQGFYEYLIGQVYGNPAGTDRAMSPGTEDDPNPEISQSEIDRLDQLREQREYLQKLRFAVEKAFNEMADRIPADTEYRPQLLRRNDHQVLADIERRREQRFERQREQRERSREAAQGMTRNVDLEVYRPNATS